MHRKMSVWQQIYARRKVLGKPTNNFGKVISYNKGHGTYREKLNLWASDREVYLIKTLCRGEKDVAERLVKSLRLRYPDKERDWIIEKAIADLERDRRVR
ncbi:hypothetical protein V2H45_12800 [Tumidithrix elongata RA019]|uniref:Transposase n=1 Tax=Tumidithrix elongata BACA0141 TaxID=2716417 RepID=A0AAW9Q4U1_9CYAN|nr:hypothetical protein [Tumidithrix elongata RA019]